MSLCGAAAKTIHMAHMAGGSGAAGGGASDCGEQATLDPPSLGTMPFQATPPISRHKQTARR